MLRLAIGAFDPASEAAPGPKELMLESAPTERARWIVQFQRTLTRADRERLQKELGLRLTDYIPDNAYLEQLTPEELERLKRSEVYRASVVYQPAFKVDPSIGKRKHQSAARRSLPGLNLVVDLFADADTEKVAAELRARGYRVKPVRRGRAPLRRLHVRVADASAVPAIARLPEVRWIEELGDVTLNNGTTSWVIQSNQNASRPIWAKGIRGEGQIVGHIDGPIDTANCFFRDTVNNTPGPSHRKVVGLRNAGGGTQATAHGTFSSGNAAGEDFNADALSAAPNANNGNAPRARLSHTYLWDLDWLGGATSFHDALFEAFADGAFIHTNSWDDKSTSAYTQLSADLDQFTWDNEDHLVIIGPDNNGTIRPPDTAKNALVVNATMQNPNQGTFSSGITQFSLDGRRKPDLMAPGAGITSADDGTTCGTRNDSGTSFAAPAVAGATALVRQYFTEGWYPTGSKQPHHSFVPSGALMKAVLLNGTVDAAGIAGYPDQAAAPSGEGWGRLLLDDALFFAGDTRNLMVWDVRNAGGLDTAEAHDYHLTVAAAGQPVKVTLVWTEPPAAANSAAPVTNNLDLTVIEPNGATTYLGNVFNNGVSATGGVGDTLNNVEQVLVNNPAPGTWTIRVTGTTVNVAPQGYALVATADTPEPPAPTGPQDTLVVRIGLTDVQGGATSSLPNTQNLVTGLANWVAAVSQNQATVNAIFPAPITLDHPRSYYHDAARNLLIEMAEETVGKLIAADATVFDRGTADPTDDIDRVILVLNDPNFVGDWATTGPWPYDLPPGLTRRLSVSVQSVFNDPERRFAHGLGHQFGMWDLYAHPNVVFAQPHVDSWDIMATPTQRTGMLAWSRQRAEWITQQGSTVAYIPRPAAGANANQTLGLNFLSNTGTNRKAIAIGLTEGAANLADEDSFYWIEARNNPGTDADNVPEEGVLVYYVNEDVPQGEGPVRILDDDLTTTHLDDGALEVGDSKSPPGTGLTVTVQNGTGGADRNVQITYDPPETDNDARITVGDPAWTSPDIWVDAPNNGFDPSHDDQPVAGVVNRIYVRISNPGPGDAFDFTVYVRVSEPYHTVGGSADFNRFVGQLHVVQLTPTTPFVAYVEWTPEDDGDPHSCIEVTFPNVFNDINVNNNRAQQNVEEVSSSSGSPYEVVSYPFGLTNSEDRAQLYYFRAEGIPGGWIATLTPKSALLAAGERVDGMLTVQPPEGAPPCTSHKIRIMSWMPRGDTLIPVGGGTFQVDLRNHTRVNVKGGLQHCRKPGVATVAAFEPQGSPCYQVTAVGCTNPARPNETIIVKYEHPSGYPIYRTVTTDANGCFSDFLVVTEGGAWEVSAEYPGEQCSGPASYGPVVVGVPLPNDGDADDDGRADRDEPQGDHDGDGKVGIHDPDSDNDGVSDGEEPAGDADQDGNPNVTDPDSDNDGTPDGRDGSPYGAGGPPSRSGLRASLRVGSAHPLGRLDESSDANIYVQADLTYRLQPRLNLKLMGGLAQFTGEDGTGPHPRFVHGSFNAQVLLLRPSGLAGYLQLGPGIYRDKSAGTAFGFNLGAGVRIPLPGPFDLEAGADYHRVFGDARAQFVTIQLGATFK